MSDSLTQTNQDVVDEVINIWKHFDPVEAYAAGLPDCKGKMFIPSEYEKSKLLGRIEKIEPRLSEITDTSLHRTAATLLNGIRLALKFDSPDAQILACFLALWYPLLKQQEQEPFVAELLKHAMEVIKSEHGRLRDRQSTG